MIKWELQISISHNGKIGGEAIFEQVILSFCHFQIENKHEFPKVVSKNEYKPRVTNKYYD